jgi:cell division septation protein DedD
MQDTLSHYIHQLLYTQSRFSLPGLGSFEVQHAPALVDQVQGQVSAPAKAITFNTNLVMDDGVLSAHIAAATKQSVAEVAQWLAAEVATIQATLDRREIVELPGVGRFFRNFEQQLQFVAENENFNLESYGLQPVTAYPVTRPQTYQRPPTPPTPSPTAPKVPVAKAPAATRWLWWVLGLLILAAFIWFVAALLQTTEPPAPSPRADVPEERLNASPSKERTEEATDVLDPTTAPDPVAEVDTEAPTLAPDEHSAVIAVGLFGNEDNVQRLVQKLSEQGFAPTTTKEGKLTRVGVAVRYVEESELQETLRDLQRLHTKAAFIMSRDGKQVTNR